MQVEKIQMDKDAALEAYHAYQREVHKRHRKEDIAIARGYRALAQGKQLLHLGQTIKAGGVQLHERTRWDGKPNTPVALPNLAVCRAHCEWCWVVTFSDGRVHFQESEWIQNRARKNIRRLPAGTLGETNEHTHSDYKAMVPVVPAALRPAHGLHNYHVLWEAVWEPTPPVDPYLIKYIGGDLYAIVAHWDLTDLERAIMTERLQ